MLLLGSASDPASAMTVTRSRQLGVPWANCVRVALRNEARVQALYVLELSIADETVAAHLDAGTIQYERRVTIQRVRDREVAQTLRHETLGSDGLRNLDRAAHLHVARLEIVLSFPTRQDALFGARFPEERKDQIAQLEATFLLEAEGGVRHEHPPSHPVARQVHLHANQHLIGLSTQKGFRGKFSFVILTATGQSWRGQEQERHDDGRPPHHASLAFSRSCR